MKTGGGELGTCIFGSLAGAGFHKEKEARSGGSGSTFCACIQAMGTGAPPSDSDVPSNRAGISIQERRGEKTKPIVKPAESPQRLPLAFCRTVFRHSKPPAAMKSRNRSSPAGAL